MYTLVYLLVISCVRQVVRIDSDTDVSPCPQEVLMQLDKQERQQKLEETFQSVVADYRRILGHVH